MSRLWYLADKVAQQLRRQARFSQDGPIDVHALARSLQVDVQQASIAQDGQFLLRERGGLVLYRSDQPRQRVSFTIAHELIHFALRDHAIGGRPAAQAVADGAFRSIERLCDCGAAALLMPHSWMVDTYGREASEAPSLSLVLTVAHAAGVSPAAAFLRLQGLFAWRRVLMSWSRGSKRWTMSSEAGTFFPASEVPRFGYSLADFLDRAYVHGATTFGSAGGPSRAFADCVPVFHPAHEAFLPAEIVVTCQRPSVTALIDPAHEPLLVADDAWGTVPF